MLSSFSSLCVYRGLLPVEDKYKELYMQTTVLWTNYYIE